MRIIHLLSGLFCIYTALSKFLKWNSLSRMTFTATNDFERSVNSAADFEKNALLAWSVVFAALVLLWISAMIRKSEKLHIWQVSLTFIFALLMSMADNMETSFYLSDIVVGGESLR